MSDTMIATAHSPPSSSRFRVTRFFFGSAGGAFGDTCCGDGDAVGDASVVCDVCAGNGCKRGSPAAIVWLVGMKGGHVHDGEGC